MSRLLNNSEVTKYLRRPARPSEREKISQAQNAAWDAFRRLGFDENAEIEITLRNRQNTNGWTVRIEDGKMTPPSRCISLAFVKERARQRKRIQAKAKDDIGLNV